MMRIMVLANNDLASNLAINLLLKGAPQHTYSILLSEKVGKAVSLPDPLKQLAFFEQQLFSEIVYNLSDKLPHPVDNRLHSFTALERQGKSVGTISNINNQQGITTVAAFKPNLIVSIRFGQILQQPIIDIPEFGVLNLHSGILPNYRGVMATFWAMLNQEADYGTTLHYIDSNQIDAGSIISVAKRPLDHKKSYLHNMLSLYPAGVKQIIRGIECIEVHQEIASEAMDLSQGRYFSHPDDQAIDAFFKQGHELLNYSEIVEFTKWYYQSPFDLA